MARAYAAATDDLNPAYLDGRFAPPVFGVVPTWDALLEGLRELIPVEFVPMILHLEQDMVFHRPLVPGMSLATSVDYYCRRVRRSGTQITVRLISEGADGLPVLEQYSTMFARGLTAGEDFGPDAPDHAFPEPAREVPAGIITRKVDADQTYRYRDASGDDNPIHVDEEFAKSVKLPGIILHGLCTMAMCGSVVVDEVAGGDPARLARLAVRFSRPVFPGSDLVVALFDGGAVGDHQRFPFDATSGGKLVVRDGLAEVRR